MSTAVDIRTRDNAKAAETFRRFATQVKDEKARLAMTHAAAVFEGRARQRWRRPAQEPTDDHHR